MASPIFVDKRALASFVQLDLVPQIVRRAERHPNPGEPVGDARGWAKSSYDVTAADGRASRSVPVQVESERSRANFVAVLGGKTSHQGVITLYLNGALTPRDLSSDERMQPVWSCRHESCVPYGLYSILLHEVTHAADALLPGKRGPAYSPQDVRERGEAAYGPYINDAGEIRAFLQQVVDEVVHHAKDEGLREHFRRDRSPNRALVDIVLTLSTTYSLIDKHLTPSNRARILKAVYEALEREGLLYGSERTARLVARYLRRFGPARS